MNTRQYEVIIIGSGIAGLSSAIYTGRGGLKTLTIEGNEPGGQLTLTTDVENYPGFPEGINGVELTSKIKEQAKQFGSDFSRETVEDIENTEHEEFRFNVLTNQSTYKTKSIIIGSGASAKKLGVPGEEELFGNGVSSCATCDGAFFKGEDMIVVGGGDAAFEEAEFLTRFADTVYIVHRREQFRAEEYLRERINEKVEEGEIEILTNTEVIEINGSKEEGVDSATLVTHPDGHPKEKLSNNNESVSKKSLPVGAVFLAIGHKPNTEFLESTDVELTESGYVVTHETTGYGETKTSVPGIFAAGDVADHYYQQAATAAGTGVKAALDATEFLSKSH